MIFKTRTPLGLHFFIVIIAFLGVYLIYNRMSLLGVIFYLTVVIVIGLYGLNKSFIVKIFDDHLEILFIRLANRKVIIDFKNLEEIKIEKSMISGQRKYHDYIYFILKNGEILELRPLDYRSYSRMIELISNKLNSRRPQHNKQGL